MSDNNNSQRLTNPIEIAREALRHLASQRIPPTPDQYRRQYEEISGIRAEQAPAERVLGTLATHLSRTPSRGAKTAPQLPAALAANDWPKVETALLALAQQSESGPSAQAWVTLLQDLLKGWETRHASITTAKKRDTLERLFSRAGSDPAALHTRLASTIKAWSEAPAATTDPAQDVVASTEPGMTVPVAEARAAARAERGESPDSFLVMRELLEKTMQYGVGSQLGQAPDLAKEVDALSEAVHRATNLRAIEDVAPKLKKLWFKLELRGNDSAEQQEGMLRLLRVLMDNISELVTDDAALHGQIEVVRNILAEQIDIRTIEDAERSLKDVIYRQSTLKHSLTEARTALKNMIVGFIDRLGSLSESTGEYHTKIEAYSQRIRQTDDIGQLSTIVDDIMHETRVLQASALRHRDDLIAARKQAQEAEEKVRQLEIELSRLSEQVREDQLTGSLNRRGLDDIFEREAARADRRNSPMCVVLLDVDNFKQLNDSYGHQAGDGALVHLVRVIKHALRPHDVIARFGGEEFLLLLPDTGIDEGSAVTARLQRELTRQIFLHDNEHLLITFSAGAALRTTGEAQESVLSRADAALYQAKRTGKNKVVAAE